MQLLCYYKWQLKRRNYSKSYFCHLCLIAYLFMCNSYYYEAVRFLSKHYGEHPERCPIPNMGASQSTHITMFFGINTYNRFRKVCSVRIQEWSEKEGSWNKPAIEITTQRFNENSILGVRKHPLSVWVCEWGYKSMDKESWFLIIPRGSL